MAEAQDKFVRAEITRYDSMPKPIKVSFLVLSTIGVGLFIFYMFGWNIRGYVLPSAGYYYLLYAAFASCVFVAIPARKKDKGRVPWYDIVFAVFSFGIPLFCFFHAESIIEIGWVPPPSAFHLALGLIFGLLALEGGRRIGGRTFLTLCVISWLYPLFAGYMPGILWGISFDFPWTVGNFAFSQNGALGLPAQVMGEILIGFLLFAGMLMASGAGRFFLNFALCLLGRFRGGPAKVAVVASGFVGSLSGSAISNVVATGAITIPTMKQIGYPSHYAGAIEACASTGGVIMPPVMGAIAFIMAVITGIEYASIIIAAFIPAVLYYFGLLMQVDAYAARVGLRGLTREELPSLKQTLKEGWPFIAVLFFLVFGLLYMRWSALAPIYASGLMFVLSFTRKETMMTPRRIIETITLVGSLITQTMAILLPVGFILGGLVMTGVSGSVTTELVALGGGSLIPVLLIGIGACYIMGCIGLGGIAYIFLAVTLAPALIKIGGLNVLAAHLFLVCYTIMGGITPPIGVVGFVAAALAGAPPMKTLVTAMRLGVVLIFLPFFFLFNPALVLQGSIWDTLYLFALCVVGIVILTGGLEGYLVKVGRLQLWQRPLLVAAGFMIALPGWTTSIAGAALAALVIAIILLRRKTAVQPITVDSQESSGNTNNQPER
jgi:TRAP transporter 4TM/12TM fusion protein